MKDNTLREQIENILDSKVDGLPSQKLAVEKLEALLAEEVRKARIEELKRNAYYSQPRKTDPLRLCGIDMTEEQVNDRIAELEKEGK